MHALILALSLAPLCQVRDVPLEKRQAIYWTYLVGGDFAFASWLGSRPAAEQAQYAAASPKIQAGAKAAWLGLMADDLCGPVAEFAASWKPPVRLTAPEVSEIVDEGRRKGWPDRPPPGPATSVPGEAEERENREIAAKNRRVYLEREQLREQREREANEEREAEQRQARKAEEHRSRSRRASAIVRSAEDLARAHKIPGALTLLRQVVKDYPDTSAAETAAGRIKALGGK